MKKRALLILLAGASVIFTGCQAEPGSGSSSSELDGLCDQYANAMKAGNIPAAQSATQAINAKMANESTGDQMKWLGECLERHNMTNR